ncbi:MAG: tetratricopeptide repeat protein [Eggerthellaceae bacterium]|nr:tetratricopeptide repeat protein [Eggerthellaceae bacterium]
MFNPFRKKNSSDAGDAATTNAGASDKAPTCRPITEVMNEFRTVPLPDAVDALLFRVSMAAPDDATVSGFEHYAARLLTEANASSLRAMAVEHPIEVRRLTLTNLLWFYFDADAMSVGQRAHVLGVESALNRLLLVERGLSSEGNTLTPIGATEAQCSMCDWLNLRLLTHPAQKSIDAVESENSLLTVNGAAGKRGGNWDVSTRLARAFETMQLPYRLEYRFDVDASCGTVAVSVTLPRPEQLPRSQWVPDQPVAGIAASPIGAWVDRTAQQPAAASTYGLRLAARVAAAAFGSSVGIARVVVHGHEDSLNNSVALSLEFDRMTFMMGVLPQLNAHGAACATGTEYNPAALFAVLKPARFAVQPDANGHNQPVQKLDAGLDPTRRTPLDEDVRPLPDDLAALLHADRVRDLDVLSTQDAALDERLRAAQADRADAPLLATAQMEDLVAEGEKLTASNLEAARADTVARGGGGENVKPLYCEGVFSRYLVDFADENPAARYSRASDVEQMARSALTELYSGLNDNDAAIAAAQRCVEMAPSSPSAYQDLITAYVAAKRYDLVVDVAKRLLRFAVIDGTIAYTYYRLAYAFWQTGRLEEAVACYARVSPASNMGESAARELSQLLGEMGGRPPMSGAESAATLRAAGVPIAPTDEAVALMSKAMVGLCDAGMPLAAAPMAVIVGSIQRNDMITATANSMKEGA